MKKLFGIIITLCSMFITPKVSAISEFATNFNSLYTIKSSGQTSVSHTISLRNNLSHIYATQYTLATTGEKIEKITATDEAGPIQFTTDIKNGITTLSIIIDRPAIGKDQVKTFTLSYETDDVVEKIGNTTTINIPRLARANEAENYTRIVKIEGAIDAAQLIYPPASKTEPEGEFAVYTFFGHLNDSLTLLFGDSVTYKMNLIYELKNKELGEIDSELALPPDTSYQHIVIKNIEPAPLDIRVDEDGNWLARYRLKAQEKLLVKTEIYATIYPTNKLYDPSDDSLKNTSHSKYWISKGDQIPNLAEQLKTPENIYSYIVNNFTYNYAGASGGSARLGAVAALINPANVLCTEFTDTFVALARSLNIPAREINGFGYTKNTTIQPQNISTDILHAWPEYYDDKKKSWVSIDPTWGNTTGGIDYFNKLDFSHITFVRHGLEDSYPLPAGAYKSDPTERYVHVEVATDEPVENISSITKDNIFYNTGNVAINNETVGYVPPYGSYSFATPKTVSIYDKIRSICARLLSIFWQPQPAST